MLPTIILLLAGCLAFGALVPSQKSWTYVLRSIQMTSSNESLAGGDCRLERISRGEYGMSGTLYFNIDLPKDLEVEANIFRSSDGGVTYKLEPYSVPRRGAYENLNTFYKDIAMTSAAKCSNFPQFNDSLELVTAQKFAYEKCTMDTAGFPNYLSDGYYKFEIKHTA
ncbi:uncharacterized protein LOC128264739 [Drosophila gunungcola]|nr:uncharacterized protein LOC128264739 [Drosophila gunungcola]